MTLQFLSKIEHRVLQALYSNAEATRRLIEVTSLLGQMKNAKEK